MNIFCLKKKNNLKEIKNNLIKMNNKYSFQTFAELNVN